MDAALGGLAATKWAASRERAAHAAQRKVVEAAGQRVAVAAFAGYGSDSDGAAGAMAGALGAYGSDSESEGGEKDVGGQRRLDWQEKVQEGADEESVKGAAKRAALERQQLLEKEEPQPKRKRRLPDLCDALSSAMPAVQDRLALQPPEPSKEDQKAERNAEQARAIEELFFWWVSALPFDLEIFIFVSDLCCSLLMQLWLLLWLRDTVSHATHFKALIVHEIESNHVGRRTNFLLLTCHSRLSSQENGQRHPTKLRIGEQAKAEAAAKAEVEVQVEAMISKKFCVQGSTTCVGR